MQAASLYYHVPSREALDQLIADSIATAVIDAARGCTALAEFGDAPMPRTKEGFAMPALAMAVIAAELIYFVVTTLFDLHPLNNVRAATPAEKRQEIAMNLPVMAAPIVLLAVGTAVGSPWADYGAVAVQAVILAGGLLLWWMPYLAGVTMPWATAGSDVSWRELHERTYTHTVIVLPCIKDRPRPNLEHMILHSLVLTGLVLAVVTATAA